MFSREKVEKSWNRTPGWVSRKAAKVLRLIRFWGGYLRPGLDFSKITPFLWKWEEFHHISWKRGEFPPFSAPWGENGAWAAPERKHQRNLRFSYAFLGVLGSKSAFRRGFSQKCSFGCDFGEIHQNGWNSAEFHHFHQIFNFWAFPAARAPQKAWNLQVL